VEVEHHLGERQLVAHLHAATVMRHIPLDAAALLTKRQDGPYVLLGHVDRRHDHRLFDAVDFAGVG
jgi:hypothetical protein